MAQESNASEWTAWITAVVAVSGLIYSFLRRFFSFVTRDEFERLLEQKHQENSDRLQRIEDKLDASQLSAISVRLSRAEQDVQDLRDWKHQIDPYIERRIDP